MINVPLDGQLIFDKQPFPPVISADTAFSSLSDAVKWVKTYRSQLETQLNEAGAILFRGFPIHSADTFDEFSAAFGYPNFTYQESLSNAVRINYTERVFTANEAPKHVEIFLHHEMAQTPITPSKLFFFCMTPADEGGATPLCRSDMLYRAIKKYYPSLAREFEEKGLKYRTTMPAENDAASGQGRSWKSTLSVRSKETAETKLRELGYSWTWLENDALEAVTPVLPAVISREDGSQVFFNQLIAAYMGWKGVRHTPSRALSFGDGSPILAEDLEKIAQLSTQFSYDVQWQAGDVALVDNYRTMHGRKPYSGQTKRQVLVALTQ